MSISSKCRYGILAVLALGENYGGGLLQIKDIAAAKNIPRQYLEQIFNRLVNAGVVSSVRGKKGGYVLAQDPAKVSVLDLVDVLEGGVQLSGDSTSGLDAINELFKKAEEKLKQDFSITLADLILRQQALLENVMYHI
ncbi:MAG: hypothetical protein A2600_02690 [Candidatus Lambdaproteobacteria bacterium RIFOXYD1_FULL_56_27]|uniref:Rrf2 family transcriptional regulator n=1 Tax=Candidatus Lambdaproteobacteria bacterium RIFOXYD2_FULL_56_26 TaxID=1817773 RepID=A0A1F6H432_9PROT|nr:MAG: hypothetical protein A2557_06755 [Candidatus Lambdaproteobacteria bacterium RIFOXYD2_FULL_56_26]OGH05421.1 MAG: hypothetical protein A2426_05080 [Candidatus Lambdaproteobacteria bacterium RIFOXYC1_FULL_56_13]OGH09561.1 MAG: hypothetical protein A2600_02690 [Candidatus Lambdaproteobacteria bacterium RIFOXYD1_FULL_56_27]